MKQTLPNRYKFLHFEKLRLLFLLTFLVSGFMGINAIAQTAGSLDMSFNSQGYSSDDEGLIDNYQKVIVQPDQKIIAVGMSWDAGYTGKVVVTRFLPNGLLDLTFGFSGSFTHILDNEALAYDAVLSPEGEIILVGTTTDYLKYRILLLKLNTDGNLVNDFGENGVVTSVVGLVDKNGSDMAYAVDLDAAGNIFVAGNSKDENYYNRPVVLKYFANGVLDTSFGVDGVATIPVTNGENTFDCVVVQPDGKIVAAGHYAESLLYFVFLMVRFETDGSLDESFGENGIIKYSYSNVDDEAFNIALRPNGKILVAGFSGTQTYNYNSLVMQYKPDGQLDSTFGVNGVASVDVANFDVAEDLKVLANGDVVVVGTSGEGPPNAYHLAVWKYKENGSLDAEFGINGLIQHEIDDYYVMLHSMAIQDDGKLVVAGQARSQQSNNDFIVCRMHLADPNGFAKTDLNNTFSIYPNPSSGANQILINSAEINTWEKAEVYSVTGSLLVSVLINQSNHSIDLPSTISSGIYFISLENKGFRSQAQKLIISNN